MFANGLFMDSALTCYIDFKSPYAYLAIEPTRHLARELGIAIDWRPFVLDIPSYLGSAKLDKSGKVAAAVRTEDQWSGVKYAYYDGRRYANLHGMTIRGTVKIWDTNLAAIGMLWAKNQSDEILHRYIDGVYLPFWKRELDVENVDVIEQVLAEAGAPVAGFKAFAQGEGAQRNREMQEAAFDEGIFGVPTYVIGEDKYFGREHLPRIRWQLQGGQGPAPDIEYELLPDSVVEQTLAKNLEVGIGLDDPETVLAIPQIQGMAEDLGLAVNWFALPGRKPASQGATDDHSRAARHRRYRRDNRQRDGHRYLEGVIAGEASRQAVASLLDHYNITLHEDGSADGIAAAAYLGGPVFRLGEEIFVGRQHWPLIRARLGKPS
jgi:2-hydroxychromene-2-carboxylate isomerase